MTTAPPPPSRRRTLVIAAAIYVVCTAVFAIFAGDRMNEHTVNNHFAVQAEVWRHGRWYLTESDITARAHRGEIDMHNDWAVVERVDPATGKPDVRYFNSFPIFPAVLMYPLVAIAGDAVHFRDAMFVVFLAGIGPALLFVALEELRRQGRSPRSERGHVSLALLYALGTVYFFSAVQGTVWFAAHVVASALGGGYLIACFVSDSLLAAFVAGLLVGCGFHTRTPFLLGALLFAFEAGRRALTRDVRADGSPFARLFDLVGKVDKRRFFTRVIVFSTPVVAALGLNLVINKARFGNPLEFGHTLLNVGWMDRVHRWGLFGFHYLSRNLTCALTLLPTVNPATAPAGVGRVQVSGNGMALWVTTPLYLWLLWPKRREPLYVALAVTAGAVALLDLLYQNSGWVQFGYRFSNDYALYLFVMLAIGGRSFGTLWKLAAAWSIAINAWGAQTFQRRGYEKYYFTQTYSVQTWHGQSTQSTTYAPD